jgi:cellulose biosynthesis protein BcsQ
MKTPIADSKKLILIAQSKGGCGKSVLAYLLAVKHPDALIVDMDDATKTTSTQLAYRKPMLATFLSSTKSIDRSKFNKFLEFVAGMNYGTAICDLGASISEQLPNYLNDVHEMLAEILAELKIDLTILVVVGGSNIFNQTMAYVSDVHKSLKGLTKVVIMKNDFFEFSPTQNKELEEYARKHNLKVFSFTLSPDINEEIQQTLKEVMKSGEGPEVQTFVTKVYFKTAAKKITYE